MADRQTIINTKVALLEILVRGIIREMALNQPDPAQAIEDLSARLRTKMEAKSKDLPQTPEADLGSVIALEVFDTFFDQLRHEVQTYLSRRQN